MVDTDRVTGAAKELAGKAQGAVGDMVGSDRDSAEGRVRQAGGAAENAYGQAKDAVRDVADRATDAARDVGDRVKDAVGDLSGHDPREVASRTERSLRGAADEAFHHAEDAYENSGRYLDQGRRAVANQVGESPIAALLIAGAVGFGLALLVTSRN